jgi:hypothetical protein
MNIHGQSAFVTGGGSGLGEAVARELARLGARVTIFDRNAEGAQRVAAEIGGMATVRRGRQRRRQCRAGRRQRRPRRAAHRDEHRRHRQGQAHRAEGRLGRAAGRLRARRPRQPDRHLQRGPPGRGAHRGARRHGRRRTRRDRQHRVGGGLRRPGRPGGLFRQQGRRGRHDAADGARPGAMGRARVHHRAGPVQDAAAGVAARTHPAVAGGVHPFPQAAGPAGRTSRRWQRTSSPTGT